MNINELLNELKYYCNKKNAIWAYRIIKQIIEHAARIEYITGHKDFLKSCVIHIDKIIVETQMKEKIQQLYRLDRIANTKKEDISKCGV